MPADVARGTLSPVLPSSPVGRPERVSASTQGGGGCRSAAAPAACDGPCPADAAEAPQGAQPLDWAVLIYSSASPDIEVAARRALEEVAAVKCAPGVAVGVQLGTRAGVERYRLDASGRTSFPSGAPDMARGSSLQDFLTWGSRALPARHTLVVVGGHGGGFLGVVEDVERRRLMPLPELVGAMRQAGVQADVLALNACLMAGAEVACEVAPQSAWLVASQAVEDREGMPLGTFLEQLRGETTPAEAAVALVDAAAATPERTPTLSALDCSHSDRLMRALDALGAAMLARPEAIERLRAHVAALPSFYGERPWDRPLSEMRDAQAFADRLAADTALPEELRAAARGLRASCADLVLASQGSGRNDARGVSLYLPLQSLSQGLGPAGQAVHALYHENLELSRRTQWDEAMELLATGGG